MNDRALWLQVAGMFAFVLLGATAAAFFGVA